MVLWICLQGLFRCQLIRWSTRSQTPRLRSSHRLFQVHNHASHPSIFIYCTRFSKLARIACLHCPVVKSSSPLTVEQTTAASWSAKGKTYTRCPVIITNKSSQTVKDVNLSNPSYTTLFEDSTNPQWLQIPSMAQESSVRMHPLCCFCKGFSFRFYAHLRRERIVQIKHVWSQLRTDFLSRKPFELQGASQLLSNRLCFVLSAILAVLWSAFGSCKSLSFVLFLFFPKRLCSVSVSECHSDMQLCTFGSL